MSEDRAAAPVEEPDDAAPAEPGTVRLLRLTTSIDVYGTVPPELRAPQLVEDELSAAIGRPVQTTLKVIWPRESMEAIVRRWLRQYRPDLVLIIVTPYWFAFESVPLKLERRKGFMKPLAAIGKKTATTRVVGFSRVFRRVRSVAHATIGGATHYEPDHVIAEVEKYVRAVRENPELPVAVYGLPASDFSGAGLNRRLEWARARRLKVYRALTAFCAAQGVPSQTGDEEVPADEWRSYREPDGVHINEAGHRRLANHQLPVLIQAWRQWHPEDALPSAALGDDHGQ